MTPPCEDNCPIDLDKKVSRLESHMISELGGNGTEGNINRQLREIRNDVQCIRRLLEGTDGTMGMKAEHMTMWRDYQQIRNLIMFGLFGFICNSIGVIWLIYVNIK